MRDLLSTWSVFLAVVLVIFPVGLSTAAEDTSAGESEHPPGMTAEQMAAWQQASSPGPEHELLAEMAGTWTVKSRFWMAPGSPPMESSGTAERSIIYGGRILVEEFTSEWQGQKFEGRAETGFDRVAGSYWSTWVDSMSTGIMVSSGRCSDNSCEFRGSFNDPMTGGPKTMRMTLRIEGDREIHEAFESKPEGEFKTMELVYTRVK